MSKITRNADGSGYRWDATPAEFQAYQQQEDSMAFTAIITNQIRPEFTLFSPYTIQRVNQKNIAASS